MKALTFSEASAVVLYFAEDFHENLPAGGYTDTDVKSLARRIAFYLDGDVKPHDVEGVIMRLAELAEVDHGTHEDLQTNRAGTVDNTADLLEHINRGLRDDLYFTVTGAGIQAQLKVVSPVVTGGTQDVTGSGSGICSVCNGKLDFSWSVKVGDRRETRCSNHVSARSAA